MYSVPFRFLCLVLLSTTALAAKQVAYIHGDVAADGTVPSGAAAPFHQMLLTDTGNRGCSQFRQLVEDQGYTITSHYDRSTTLNSAFLDGLDVVVFGLHQKVWSRSEAADLYAWIQAGGGILMYSDSAAGGHYQQVGIKNATGQRAVNSLLGSYGMQVTVDQGGGTRSYTSDEDACDLVVADQPVFEGEGVSPIAVDERTGARVLIPLEDAYKVGGGSLSIDTRNVTIANPRWAVLAHREVGKGNVMAIFDRQPVWNNGEGSHINRRDNKETLRRIVRFLARDYANTKAWFAELAQMRTNPADGHRYLEYSYRQWQGGEGDRGEDYTVHGVPFRVEHAPTLTGSPWRSGPSIVEPVGSPVDLRDGTEQVTVRLFPDGGYVRLNLCPAGDPAAAIQVDAGRGSVVKMGGTAVLSGSVTGAGGLPASWRVASGPGSATFADSSSPTTTVEFDASGTYNLELSVGEGPGAASDSLLVEVVDPRHVVRAINCGGSAYAGSNGFSYEADALFTGGHVDAFPGNPVAQTGDDPLYNYARSAHSAYTIPVANGTYLVYLQFAETFFGGTGQRVFDTRIEGALRIDDLDLVAAAPGKWVAYDRSFEVTVNDGQLDLGFSASANNALLNGLVVIQH